MNLNWKSILKKAGIICLSTILFALCSVLIYITKITGRMHAGNDDIPVTLAAHNPNLDEQTQEVLGERRTILELKDQLVRHEYEMVKQMQKEQETLSHNMKNHLLVLHSMLREGRTGDAVTYLSQLQEPLDHLSPSIWAGTPTLDILLNHARHRCALADVRFTIQADALDLSAMEDQDICSLFSNLLDNTCEAAARMSQGQGWILVKLRRIKEMVFIDISNSACEAPLKRGGRLVSQKQESRLHGIGLNSASMTAAKYAGTLEYTYEDNIFSVRVSFLSGIIGI